MGGQDGIDIYEDADNIVGEVGVYDLPEKVVGKGRNRPADDGTYATLVRDNDGAAAAPTAEGAYSTTVGSKKGQPPADDGTYAVLVQDNAGNASGATAAAGGGGDNDDDVYGTMDHGSSAQAQGGTQRSAGSISRGARKPSVYIGFGDGNDASA